LDDDSDGSEIGGDRDIEQDDNKSRLKNKEKEDWNYLKSTLGG
jgi:hypothetical protein